MEQIETDNIQPWPGMRGLWFLNCPILSPNEGIGGKIHFSVMMITILICADELEVSAGRIGNMSVGLSNSSLGSRGWLVKMLKKLNPGPRQAGNLPN